MPVGFSIVLTAVIAMWVSDVNPRRVPVQMFSGTNDPVLLAIPLFIPMGESTGATSSRSGSSTSLAPRQLAARGP